VDGRREGRPHQGRITHRTSVRNPYRNDFACSGRDTPAEAEFRTQVRTWLEANLSRALRDRTTRPPPAELMPWYHALSKKGWIAPHWPKQYGGMGATLNEQIIMTEGAGARRPRRICRSRVSITSGRS